MRAVWLDGRWGRAVATAVTAVGATAALAGPAPAPQTDVSTCPVLEPRVRSPRRFVEGLVGAWIPLEARDCLYLLPSRMTRPVPIFRFAPRRRLRGPVWSPTQPELAVSYRRDTGFEVALLDTDGRALRRFVGRDAAFLRDGRLLVRRSNGIWIAGGRRTTHLVRLQELARAAGFPIVGLDLSGADGYGRAGAIVSTWGNDVSRLLLIRPDGTVSRVTPIYRAQEGTSMPGPPAWSPDGGVLLVPWQRIDPHRPLSHEHCLARWTAARGYRSTRCRNPHFDRVLWHPDGGTALLNNGLVVGRDGRVRARIRIVGRAASVRWKRPLLDSIG